MHVCDPRSTRVQTLVHASYARSWWWLAIAASGNGSKTNSHFRKPQKSGVLHSSCGSHMLKLLRVCEFCVIVDVYMNGYRCKACLFLDHNATTRYQLGQVDPDSGCAPRRRARSSRHRAAPRCLDPPIPSSPWDPPISPLHHISNATSACTPNVSAAKANISRSASQVRATCRRVHVMPGIQT